MKKIALALMAASAVMFGTGLVANAYPPDAPVEEVSDPTPAPGGTFTVTVGCTPIGDSVTFTLASTPPQTVTVLCEAVSGLTTGSLIAAAPIYGEATATFTAPTEAGTYTISYTGAASGSVTITVEGAATPPGGLPATGSNGTSTMTIIAIGLFAVGAGLFGVSQVRRRTVVA